MNLIFNILRKTETQVATGVRCLAPKWNSYHRDTQRFNIHSLGRADLGTETTVSTSAFLFEVEVGGLNLTLLRTSITQQ